MIAPIKDLDPKTTGQRGRLKEAYRTIAATFLPGDHHATDDPPPIGRVRAWLFAGWVVIVTGVYFVVMLT
jgi:hypothetical protein